ncbi:MAG: glycosyltransferase family A protein [Sulfuricellaceae bacterium]|nr:glycosyltransferase family A protein [Sulfuricellaceae bacterium]
MALNPRLNDPDRPLVSMLIFNYNYGRYLRECFDSVLAQTYDNIEINFSDNASTDDSWEIALEYQKRYPSTIFIARNRQNFGTDANFKNCAINARGKYFVELCSDDALLPDFTRICIKALESNLDAGFALVHRTILDENGKRIEEPPFYNQTCKIPGAAQAAVYMMAAVNPAVTQIMYRKMMSQDKSVSGGLGARYYGTRIMDFHICCEHPIVYIKTPLMLHRLHLLNDSFRAADNMMEVIGPYVLNLQFVDMARPYGHQEVVDRLPASVEKIARLALRYSVRALISGSERNALKYFHLSAAFFPEIVEDVIFNKLTSYWMADADEKKRLLDGFQSESNLVTRTISYDPPVGSILISLT